MLRRILLSLFATCLISQSVFAQDLFLTFGQGANVTNTTQTASPADLSGTAFLYSRNGFDFDAIDLFVDSSDSSVVELTGGTIFNSDLTFQGAIFGTRFIFPNVQFEPERNQFGTPIDENGDPVIDANQFPLTDDNGIPRVPVLTDTLNIFAGGGFFDAQGVRSATADFDADFDPDADAFLIAEIQFSIVGEGTADLELSFAELGILLPNSFDPITDESAPNFLGFGSATLNVVNPVPEPSSAALLALGLAGILARRRR